MTLEPTCNEIDLRGQICPSTLLTALREVNSRKAELQSGSLRISFLTDNRSSTTHIVETVTNMGYQVQVEKHDSHYCISVSRGTR